MPAFLSTVRMRIEAHDMVSSPLPGFAGGGSVEQFRIKRQAGNVIVCSGFVCWSDGAEQRHA